MISIPLSGSSMQVHLQTENGEGCIFKILLRYKAHSVGEQVANRNYGISVGSIYCGSALWQGIARVCRYFLKLKERESDTQYCLMLTILNWWLSYMIFANLTCTL